MAATDMPRRSESLDVASLSGLSGNVIRGIKRIWYVYKGETSFDVGPLELTFAADATVLFDAGPDGEELVARNERWVDPFAPPLTAENQHFVDTSGKWTVFDVSNQEPYEGLVGATVNRVEPHLTRVGKLVGVTIHTSGGVLRVNVEADELIVKLD